MNNILYTGRSALSALQKKIDTVTNNIANMNTTGYKRLDQNFQELLRNEIGQLGTPMTEELERKAPTIGSGVKVGDTYRIFEQGILTPSGNPLEVAIEGNGFFGFEDENGDLILSRIGAFSVNEDGELIDRNGYRVTIDDDEDLTDYKIDSIIIDSTGEMFAENEDGEMESVGKIILYDIYNKERLLDAGEGYYRVPDDVELLESTNRSDAEFFGTVNQGFSEMSNVEAGKEMINLMILERAYQLNARTLDAADKMWQMANNLRR